MYAAAAASSSSSSSSTHRFLLIVVAIVFFFTTAPFSIGQDVAVAKETHLHFYLHEVLSGPNTTVGPVRGLTYNPTSFSSGTVVIEDLLTEGPEPSSKPIGRAQGTGAVTSLNEDATLTIVWHFVFSSGDYNGSTLALLGRAELASSAIEFSVVGGTGQLRLARGYVIGKNLTAPAGSLVIELDACIEHY